MTKIEELALAMIDYNNGDPKRIQHTTKVHAYASLIGKCEGLDNEMLFILESAALVSGRASGSTDIRTANSRNRKVLL